MKKKILMLGASAVGKTSLVQRFVKGIFSEKYLTTIGVKIDKKQIIIRDQTIDLMIWDINGDDDFQEVQTTYFRGASGYLLVVDGTRMDTLNRALILQKRVEKTMSRLPFILVVNKSDLDAEWEIEDSTFDKLSKESVIITRTSAKSGQGVEDAFLALSKKIIEG